MRKLFQWALLTSVGVGLLVVVVHQYFTVTTGRARDASVAALKLKLEERRLKNPPSTSNPISPRSDAAPITAPSDVTEGDELLRLRWRSLFNSLAERTKPCDLSSETWTAIKEVAFDVHDVGFAKPEQVEIDAYLTCSRELFDELVALSDDTADFGRLMDSVDWIEDYDAGWYVRQCERLLRVQLMLSISVEDFGGGVRALRALVGLSTIRTLSMRHYWELSDYWTWKLVEKSIQSGSIPEVEWDRLLARLDSRRDVSFFVESMEADTDSQLYSAEHWADADLGRFRDYPIGYLRNWAYPRVSTALYNHDVDRFSRAMSALLDLSHLPYYEAKPELEEFYDAFDVESGPHQLKFMRGNSGWYYILRLSRVDFMAEARRMASIDMIRFSILLDRHRRAHGAYPVSLDVFAEEFSGRVPVNPLDGKPYVYERLGDSFRLSFREEWSDYFVEEHGYKPAYTREWHEPPMSARAGRAAADAE